jgi:hypothetical protein
MALSPFFFIPICPTIAPILGDTRIACHAWALMPNRFHLLLQTGQTQIATLIRRLSTG